MDWTPGARFGPYEIVSSLGAGGMGEVYRARDTRLGRDVALKVLLPAFARDAERMARFTREAQLLAALNHPNIASLYGLEDSGGVRALVMELVEGPTLAQRIAEGPLPLDEALEVARQVAEALEAAHERSVIHRDLKPANIKVTPAGRVKVLDFGLAKALDDSPAAGGSANSPTLSIAATRAGMILGTAAYMSPEQAKGKPVDRRADIWAFGAVIYEMLAGRQVYSGETAAETLASVMKDAPAWERLPASTPAAIRKLLGRCLEKDSRRRLRDIGEGRILIEDTISGAAAEEMAEPAAVARPAPAGRLRWAATIVPAAVAAALIAWFLKPAPPEPPLRKFEIAADRLRTAIDKVPVISPDGRKIVYAAGDRLLIRELDQLEPRELVSGGDPTLLFWSPDSAFVAYVSQGKLWRVAAAGGQPATIAVVPNLGRGGGGAWRADGRIVFASALRGTGLQEVSAQGGDFAPLLQPEPKTEQDFHEPSLLPDGRGVVFVIDRAQNYMPALAVFDGKSRKVILELKGENLRSPVYSPTGHILYHRETNNPGIWALPFSLAKLDRTGEPFLVVPQGMRPSVARDGTLAFIRGTGGDLRRLVWVDRAGKIDGAIGEPQRGMWWPDLSPDGRRVAVAAGDSGKQDIWVYDAARQTRTRLTFTDVEERFSSWSPAGTHIVFDTREGTMPSVVRKAADGTGQTEKIVTGMQPAVSRDGKFLVYAFIGGKTAYDLGYVSLEGDRKPVVFLEAPGMQSSPRFSPDGRYLAYVSNESGRNEIYIKPFPSGEGKWQVSFTRGVSPHWNRSGDRLYYESNNQLMEVEVATRPSLTLGTPRVVFSGEAAGVDLTVGFDVSPDGKRFVALQEVTGRDSRPPAITVVENWVAEFRDRSKK